MLKWETKSPEEEPIRLPKLFTYLIITSFLVVLYLWQQWLSLLLEHNQIITLWLQQ